MTKVNLWLAFLVMLLAGLSSCKKNTPKATPDNNIYTLPLAQFTWNGAQHVNAEIQFINQSENADVFKWNFGNGQISNQYTPPKVKYDSAGVYNVILTAIKGNEKAIYKQLIAIAPDNNPLAHFSFSYTNQQTYVPAVVQFKNQSVNALTYEWEIKGNVYHETDPKVTFNQPGNYPVKLTAINGNQQHEFTDTVEIAANTNPIAKFTLPYHPFPYTVNEEIQLVNLSQNADNWQWTFGNDGPPASTDEHPVIKFTKAGTYTIQLIARKGTTASAPRAINLKINQ